MAEEATGAPAASEGTQAKAAPEGKPTSAPQESSYEVPEEIQRKVNSFDQINTRYLNDPQFAKIMNYAIQGKYDAVKVIEKLENHNENQDSPDVALRRELKELKQDLSELKNTQTYKDVVQYRNDNGAKYRDVFDNLAEQQGYLPNTDGYDVLFALVEREGKLLAHKHGIVNDAGQPDPNLKFNQKLIEEAFKKGHEKFVKTGYDPQEVRRKELLKMKQKKAEQKEARLNDFFNPENLKTPQSRAKALERAFKHQMLEKYGEDMNDYKITN